MLPPSIIKATLAKYAYQREDRNSVQLAGQLKSGGFLIKIMTLVSFFILSICALSCMLWEE